MKKHHYNPNNFLLAELPPHPYSNTGEISQIWAATIAMCVKLSASPQTFFYPQIIHSMLTQETEKYSFPT